MRTIKPPFSAASISASGTTRSRPCFSQISPQVGEKSAAVSDNLGKIKMISRNPQFMTAFVATNHSNQYCLIYEPSRFAWLYATLISDLITVSQAQSAGEIKMEIRVGPSEANLMDAAPAKALTPAPTPTAGQIRQSPDGANSSVIDATSTCGRASVANMENVIEPDDETKQKSNQEKKLFLFD